MAFVQYLPSIKWALAGASACLICCAVIFPWRRFFKAIKAGDSLQRKVWSWAVISLLFFGAANGFFYQAQSANLAQAPNAATVFSVYWAVSVAILIILLIFSIDEVKQPGIGVLSAIAGGVAGWLLGMYVSPQGDSEQQQFAKFGTAVVALFSGLTLKVAYDWLSKEENRSCRIYCALFVLSAGVSTAAIYNVRAYGIKEIKISVPQGHVDPSDKHKASAKTGCHLQLYASLAGSRTNSVVRWDVILPDQVQPSPSDESSIGPSGLFYAQTDGAYKVRASSEEDPKISDVVEVTVSKSNDSKDPCKTS